MSRITLGRAFAFALATTLAAVPATAQRGLGRDRTGRGYLAVGVMSLDLDALNAALKAAGYPAMGSRFLTVGGAGFGEHGRWLVGGAGQGLVGDNESTTTGAYEVSLHGGYGLFKVGYKIVSRPDCDLTPTIGLGARGMRLNIIGRNAPTFGGVLADPGRSSRLTSTGFVMDLGLSANHLFRNAEARGISRGGLLIGAAAGYLIAPGSARWRLDDINTVAGAPNLKLEGFYARLAIGGWRRGPRIRT